MFADDRTYLENKYHDTSKPFNPFERMAYHGYAFDETTGLDDEGVKKGLAELEKQLSALLKMLGIDYDKLSMEEVRVLIKAFGKSKLLKSPMKQRGKSKRK